MKEIRQAISKLEQIEGEVITDMEYESNTWLQNLEMELIDVICLLKNYVRGNNDKGISEIV